MFFNKTNERHLPVYIFIGILKSKTLPKLVKIPCKLRIMGKTNKSQVLLAHLPVEKNQEKIKDIIACPCVDTYSKEAFFSMFRKDEHRIERQLKLTIRTKLS